MTSLIKRNPTLGPHMQLVEWHPRELKSCPTPHPFSMVVWGRLVDSGERRGGDAVVGFIGMQLHLGRN